MRTLSLNETEPVFARIRADSRVRVIRNAVLMVLVFLLVLLTDMLLQIVTFIVIRIGFGFAEGATGEPVELSESVSMIVSLFFTTGCILLCFLFCRLIEGRKIRTMGLTKQHMLRDYLIGTLTGIGMMGAAVLLIWAGGGAEYIGAVKDIPPVTMLLFVLGWAVQGFSEELCFRGFCMMSLGTHHKPVTAVSVSAVLFAAAHLLNSGISVWAVINLTLFGIFAALYFLRTDSIWGIAALHSFWNMAQGNIFGLKVSGIDIPETFLRFSQTAGHTWLNGGEFGPEGGAAVTLVLTAGIVIVWLLPQRSAEIGIAAR